MIVAMVPRVLSRSDLVILVGGGVAVVLAVVTRYAAATPAVLAFVTAAIAVALLASLVARSVEQLGDRFGPGGTGVLQSALGNLPELFIGFFALRAGLVEVVQAAIIGSVLATAALVVPSIAAVVHTPAERHKTALSVAVSVVLLAVFALSLPASLRRHAEPAQPEPEQPAQPEPRRPAEVDPAHPVAAPRWPAWLAIGLLALSGVLAALVSDWFVHALTPAIEVLGISQAFAGLVVVAIAGNAIENVVGIQLAARNQADYALSVIVNSPLQVALVLAPALVLLSFLTPATLTLVFAPMLVIAVVLTVVVVWMITEDGESSWLEGVILVALYAIIAAVFWWG